MAKPVKRLLDSVLASVSEQGLKRFVRRETVRNKYLEIKLLSYFIESIDLDDFPNKYQDVMEEVVRESTTGKLQMSRRRVTLLNDVIKHWLKLSSENNTHGYYPESVASLMSIVRHVHRFLDKTREEEPVTRDLLRETYRQLMIVASRNLAPELRYAIEEQGLEILSRSYHQLHDPAFNMVSVLASSDQDVRLKDALPSIVYEKCLENPQDEHWLVWHAILQARYQDTRSNAALFKGLGVERIERIIATLAELEQREAIAWFQTHTPAELKSRVVRSEIWQRWIFRIAENEEDDSAKFNAGIRLLAEAPTAELYGKLATDEESRDAVHRVLTRDGRYDSLASIHSELGNSEALWDLISETRFLPAFSRYYPMVADHLGNDLLEKGWALLRYYVSHHAGVQCTEVVQAFFDAAELNGNDAEVREWTNRIIEEFPGRFKVDPVRLKIS